jgi:signal transduction histidine kinase
VERVRFLTRSYGFDALIGLGAVASALIVLFSADADNAPTSPLWFAVPAIAIVVLPLLCRRRFPFAAPASVWLIAAGLSFIDGRLVVLPITVYVAGMVEAYLLGNLPDGRQACLGLAVTLVAITIIVVNNPDHAAGDYALPALFAIAWLAGFALRSRAAHAEAAEQRAMWLEQTREQDARRAIDEERARIARELHDVVAHSVSVMTVQTSAVRRLLMPEQEKERHALLTVEQTGREALTESVAWSACCVVMITRRRRWRRNRAWPKCERWSRTHKRPGSRLTCRSRASRSACRQALTSLRIGWCRRG